MSIHVFQRHSTLFCFTHYLCFGWFSCFFAFFFFFSLGFILDKISLGPKSLKLFSSICQILGYTSQTVTDSNPTEPAPVSDDFLRVINLRNIIHDQQEVFQWVVDLLIIFINLDKGLIALINKGAVETDPLLGYVQRASEMFCSLDDRGRQLL